jgi:hypothetical protein
LPLSFAKQPLRDRYGEWRPHDKQDLDVEDFLRVYAPDVLDLAPFLVARRELLMEGVPPELERRWMTGGRPLVDEYLAELNRTMDGVEQFRRRLAEFIVREFPPPGGYLAPDVAREE